MLDDCNPESTACDWIRQLALSLARRHPQLTAEEAVAQAICAYRKMNGLPNHGQPSGSPEV